MDASGGPRGAQDPAVLPQHYDHALQSPPTPSQRTESPRSPEDWSLGDGADGRRSAGLTPPATACPTGRQNQVSTVNLHGVPIVSLNIDNKERLCLAQISNTLLKDYSYNEIHNRRVALGITCVQCTPVQLEILRRAGAMPVSSRRCGMITKREAERLVKSFLEDSEPPKLPEGFAFQVYHECGWGCHGYFEPARYNSSRAKCIKCGFCSVYFSPNKFIFHFHRTAEAKYHHPDAANFNSWRRHLKLAASDMENEVHLWEDVKAMFNGGTRKRIFSTSRSRLPCGLSAGSSCPRSEPPMTADLNKKSSKVNSSSNSGEMQVTNKHPFSNHFSPYPWYGPGPKPSYPFVSVNTSQSLCFGFPPSAAAGGKDGVVAAAEHPPILKGGVAPMSAPWLGRTPLPFSNLDAFWDKAFGLPRPLGPGLRSMYPPSIAKAPSEGPLNECLGGGIEGRGEPGERSSSDDGVSERKRPRKDSFSMNAPNGHHVPHYRQGSVLSDRLSAFRPVGRSTATPTRTTTACTSTRTTRTMKRKKESSTRRTTRRSMSLKRSTLRDNGIPGTAADDSGMSDESEGDAENEDNPLLAMSKEELCHSLKKELCYRKRREKEVSLLKETFQEEVSREKAFRDQMARQLEVLRETLTSELEQERKVRFSLQQKLKEAHDALHSFSCSMLTAARDCGFKDTMLPR
ncbi:SKI family transcriptional corepressor 1-like [Pomacea canaliculata]|uniref:SKI family transcriptional corepressor 1-like n=1 Tax=Pomacea canaliculata TaxID=400727 RepID=UPI000D735843|nr:SKI family transcriptional corepressor 1-like [Pomacea canaliculata]